MATQTTKIAGLPYVPRKYSVVERGGKAYVTTRGRRQYKTPAKTRKRIAAGLRRIKLPLLTMAAVGIPIGTAITRAGGMGRVFSTAGFTAFGNSLIMSYTGYSPVAKNWRLERLMEGLLPLGALMVVRRLGVFRGVNNQLTRMRVPFRLS